MEAPTLRGHLLVANPAMPDPNFRRTVVLMLEHTDEGALGVVLNRPSDAELAEPLPQWARLAADPPVLFTGGPVEPAAAIAIAEMDPFPGGEGWQELDAWVGMLDLTSDEDEITRHVRRLRVFSGYAGWGAGQLETELGAGAWFVVAAVPDDALSAAPRRLWHDVLRRQGGWLATVAAFPAEPRIN